ncbi:MAG: hypothetical protein M8357_00925 [Desulfobulbaceae bacterium]|nr:hypothetical protein [Desulfobulbaceae bacterium]
MKLKDSNLHQKLQEMCDCYLETDFAAQLKAMSKAPSTDIKEDAVKYLALALMYGVTDKARKVSFKKKGNKIKAVLKVADEKIELPPPTVDQFNSIVELVRGILHFESGGGSSMLALGLRNSRLDLQVKLKEKEGKNSLRIVYPELGE